MPRPPIQHHRLLLTLPDDWEDVLDKVREIVVIKAVGRASAGFLGNPALGVFFIGAVLAGLGGILGLEAAEVISDFFIRLQNLHNAEPGSGEQRAAANDFIDAQRAFIEFFFPLFKFVPPLEPEIPPPPSGGGGGGGGSG